MLHLVVAGSIAFLVSRAFSGVSPCAIIPAPARERALKGEIAAFQRAKSPLAPLEMSLIKPPLRRRANQRRTFIFMAKSTKKKAKLAKKPAKKAARAKPRSGKPGSRRKRPPRPKQGQAAKQAGKPCKTAKPVRSRRRESCADSKLTRRQPSNRAQARSFHPSAKGKACCNCATRWSIPWPASRRTLCARARKAAKLPLSACTRPMPERRLRSRFRAQPSFTGTGRSLRNRSGAEADRARHLRHLRDVGQTDSARAAGGDSVCAIHGRMPVAARETEQGFARPAIGHVALRSDRRRRRAKAKKKKPRRTETKE